MFRIFNFLKRKNELENISVFLLKAEMSFKSVAQVSYKNENGDIKIVRFYGDYWSREILSYSSNLKEIDFKFFVHTPNIKKDEHVRLSIERYDKLLLSKEFIIDKDKEFSEWFTLTPMHDYSN